MIRRFNAVSPAKVNLALHVVGQRMDGYHLIETLVTFTEYGDYISICNGNGLDLSIDGPFAGDLQADNKNLIMQAAKLLYQVARDKGNKISGARINLVKNLPVASGIGGGSANAAVALKLLKKIWQLPDNIDLVLIAKQLGADIPMCILQKPLLAYGIGTNVELLPDMPSLSMVLINPGIKISTRECFERLQTKYNSSFLKNFKNYKKNKNFLCIETLKILRNDLEFSATNLAPSIKKVLNVLNSSSDCFLARMSGSGSTCFGIFKNIDVARKMASYWKNLYPEWWILATMTTGKK